MRDSLTVEIVRVRQENPEVTTLYVARPFDFMARPIAFLRAQMRN